MACATSCKTRNHDSYGQCLRSQNVAVYGLESTGSGVTTAADRKWNSELDRARRLMSQGVMPDNTFTAALDKAEKASDETGTPYRADG